MRREDETRLGVALTIGTGAIDQLHELESGPARRKRPVDGKLSDPSSAQYWCGEAIVQEFDQVLLLLPLELEAGRHGVAATLEEKPVVDGVPDDGAKIDRGDRARGPSRRAI